MPLDRWSEIDLRYLRICREYAQLSRCMSRRVGALLTTRDGIVIGMGVNGPPRGIKHCSQIHRCARCGDMVRDLDGYYGPCDVGPAGTHHFEPLTQCPRHMDGGDHSLGTCPAVHAEVNALLACGRTNNSTVDCCMYIWPLGPCKDCTAQMIQAGISRLVFPEGEAYDDLGPVLLEESGIGITKYPLEDLESLPFAPR